MLLMALLCCTLIIPAMLQAATVPTGFQEYRVVGYAEHVYNMLLRSEDAGDKGLNQTVGFLNDAMASTVSATASSDNQIIYYDHWEDGDDTALDSVLTGTDPATVTFQSTTLIFGDGNASNGDACDYVAGTCSNDLLLRGDSLNLISYNDIFGADPADCNNPDELASCITIPRDTNEIRFDGGDRLIGAGGPVTLVHVQEPAADGQGWLGSGVEILPKQAVEAATSYSIPIGEDLFTGFGGSDTPGEPFLYVDLNIVAFEDNTSVQVTSPGETTINFTLKAWPGPVRSPEPLPCCQTCYTATITSPRHRAKM